MKTARRFWDAVDKEDDGCWIWLRRVDPNGYGVVDFQHGGRSRWLAHRLAYTLTCGPIPEGLTLDHACRVRRCVNPKHLEAVPRSENSRRVWSRGLPRKPMRNRVVREEDVYWLAAQMESAVTEVDLSDAVRAFLRKHGRRHWKAAREAWAELEAAAPPGKPPTREQVQDFLETYREQWEERGQWAPTHRRRR